MVAAQRKRTILRTTAYFAAVAVIVSIILPTRLYRFCIVIAPTTKLLAGFFVLAQMGNLGGVAALAGGSLGLEEPERIRKCCDAEEPNRRRRHDRAIWVDAGIRQALPVGCPKDVRRKRYQWTEPAKMA